MIRRVYVEKKAPYRAEADRLCRDIQENLHIPSLTGLRILNRYDIAGLGDEAYKRCRSVIFADLPVDILYEEEPCHLFPQEDTFMFAVSYLPGQYDQRADSAVQCIQITSLAEQSGAQCVVETAKVYVLRGKLTEEEKRKIKQYCINPVDSKEAPLEPPQSLGLAVGLPEPVKTITGFIRMTDEQAEAFRLEQSFSMSREDLLHCRQYFQAVEKRDPTVTELRVIDTYWSDHCRHTTFLTELEEVVIEPGFLTRSIEKAYVLYREESGRTPTLMDIATAAMRALKKKGVLTDLDESDEINACSIRVDVDVDGKTEPWLVMFKNETHNHPTEIEPFGGAATCLGGAIRDPLSGRSYVYQAMRVTGSGDPLQAVADTLPGKLPQSKITTVAAAGYSSYGNQVGIATGKVAEFYDKGYVSKRMEIGAVVGAAPENRVVRRKPLPGDLVILVGGRTGRDGCGGASGSSVAHGATTIETCGAQVQKGNPPTERKLQRLFRNPEASRLIKRCNDFGAGGVCVAIGELAEGLDIDLDTVPKKYEGLDGTELAISESQERMAVVVAEEDAQNFIGYAMAENLEATVVAHVTSERRLVMRLTEGTESRQIVDISRDFLDTNGAKQTAAVRVSCPDGKKGWSKRFSSEAAANRPSDGSLLTEVLSGLNVAAQKGLGERFDSTIGAGTVLMPFGGSRQFTPAEAMAAKIPVETGETSTVTLMSYGYDPSLSTWSPFHGAVFAVVESVAKIVAAGGAYGRVRLSFQEYFESLRQTPERWGKPFASLLGGFYAQMMLGVPAIGGKDSMSGTFTQEDGTELNVPPTLVSFALGIGDVEDVISPEFKKTGSLLLLLEANRDEEGLPDFIGLKKNFALLHELIQEKAVISAGVVGIGGLGAAAAKMAFGNEIGVELSAKDLYGAAYGNFLLEVDRDSLSKEELETRLAGYSCRVIGKTLEEKVLRLNGYEIGLDTALTAWMQPLEKIFPVKYGDESPVHGEEKIELRTFSTTKGQRPGLGLARPRVFIPVFPGTNCEYDTARAFEREGALADIFVIRNLTPKQLAESIREMEKRMGQAQIIALPGGFSAGDEPDGSGKFIAAVFRNPYITESVRELLQNRDGLMLGICNGFQALVKLGLVPYGDITEPVEGNPTLTYNAIGRHVSCLVKTKIISNRSPWLWETEPGTVHTVAVSHGEGRFVADSALLRRLNQAGQIATTYVDPAGQPTMELPYNPNGSDFAVEGLTSPDGRILGKMGHSERTGRGLYKNAAGEEDMRQGIFAAGVRYFQ